MKRQGLLAAAQDFVLNVLLHAFVHVCSLKLLGTAWFLPRLLCQDSKRKVKD